MFGARRAIDVALAMTTFSEGVEQRFAEVSWFDRVAVKPMSGPGLVLARGRGRGAPGGSG